MGINEINKEDSEKFSKAISYLYKADIEFKNQKKLYEGKKEKANEVINRLFDKYGIQSVQINKGDKMSPMKLVCKRITRNSVNFDADALEDKLGKEICLEFVNKEYTVNDMDGLVNLLKKSGVSPKEFKKFISVTKTVDKTKLDQLSNLGDISEEDIEGCYSVTENSSYLSVRLAKEEK